MISLCLWRIFLDGVSLSSPLLVLITAGVFHVSLENSLGSVSRKAVLSGNSDQCRAGSASGLLRSPFPVTKAPCAVAACSWALLPGGLSSSSSITAFNDCALGICSCLFVLQFLPEEKIIINSSVYFLRLSKGACRWGAESDKIEPGSWHHRVFMISYSLCLLDFFTSKPFTQHPEYLLKPYQKK